jgi:hypothetical protein
MPNSDKYTICGSELLTKIKELIHQGNIRRVRVIHGGRPLIDIPLTIGASATAITVLTAPVLAALGALAALLTECTIEVEKVDKTGEGKA